jgi:hypothetical protein
MTVFAAVAPVEDARLEAAVKAKFEEGSYYKITPSQFLIYSPTLTTQQVSERLGAPNDGVGRVMIVPFTNYAGWHSREMWEWIASHIAPPTLLTPPDAPGGSG